MDNFVIRQLDKLESEKVALARYRVTSIDPITVQGEGQNVEVDSAMGFDPIVGAWCWGIRQSGRIVLLGFETETPPPAVCTVAGTGNPVQLVTEEGKNLTAPYLASYTPSVGDQVAVLWTASGRGWSGVVLGKISTVTPPPPPIPIGPRVTSGAGEMKVPPLFSWPSYDGWWDDDEDDPGQGRYGSGQLLSGWWMYGDGAFGIVAGKEVSNGRITLNRIPKWNPSSSALTATLALHSHADRGSRAPMGADILATVDIPGVEMGKRDYPVPDQWLKWLADPAHPAKGVGVVPGANPNLNYILFASTRDDPECGRISCDWSG